MPAQTQVGRIDPNTGHMTTDDDVALYRAIGPDRGDPPNPFPGRGFPIRPPGGPPHGGPPGGPPGGGGPPNPGGAVPPILPAARNNTGSDKLVGNPPSIFTGERPQAEQFLTQWQLYVGTNDNTELMRNAYKRSMLFLTYIQGPQVNEWVKSMSEWLRLQVGRQGIARHDEWLWESTELSFNRQYADILTQEKAKALLRQGFKMERGDIDGYIAKFEQAVRQAGLDVRERLVVDKFADGLPNEMYEYIYDKYNPHTYEQWRAAAIERQKKWIHIKGRLNAFKTTSTPRTGNTGWQGVQAAPRNPYAMDTSPGRTRARIAEVEDASPGGNQNPNKFKTQQREGQRNNREVICYNCQKAGHIARDCRQRQQQRYQQGPRQWGAPRQWGGQRQGPSRTRRAEEDEDNVQVARQIVDDRTKEQKAQDWLTGVANEDDDIKDMVMQELWKKNEGF